MAHRSPHTHRYWHLVLTGLMLVMLAGPALAADPILARMAGNWVGHGFARATPDGTREPAYCKTANVLDGDSLTQTGRCAFGPDSGKFTSRLTALGEGRYEGASESPLVEGATSVTGTVSDGRLILISRGVSKKSGEIIEAETTIKVDGESTYTMLTRSKDPETGNWFEYVELIFTPAE